MNYEIVQLRKEDYEEAMDFINMVFSMSGSPINFPELLPTYYKPTDEHMKCHQVIKEGGKIRALVGIYPGELVIGESSFKVARIGAVSSHPYHRNSGLMQTLMKHCIKLIKEQGYDMANLGGLRYRYMHYGFEKCGSRMIFYLNKYNLKNVDKAAEDIVIKKVDSVEEVDIKKLKNYHDNQQVKFNRSEEDFYDICNNWKHRLFAVYKGQQLSGYIVADEGKNNIYEAAGEDLYILLLALQRFTLDSGNWQVAIEVSPGNLQLAERLGKLCEGVEIKDVENWAFYNWKEIISSLIRVKNSYYTMQDGEMVLGIKGYGNIEIIKKGQEVTCRNTEKTAVIEGEFSEISRLLFGPAAPYHVLSEAVKTPLSNSWFPLPLYVSNQDFS